MLQEYVDILGQELLVVSAKVVAFLPNFLIGVLILLIGWLFGVILGRATIQIFNILGLEKFFAKAGLERLLENLAQFHDRLGAVAVPAAAVG